MMQASTFSLQQYTQCIAYTGRLESDLATISALMQAQLQHIAFENLDVQAGHIVNLNPDYIADKILNHQRGGYCYEVNGLFAMALAALGIPYFFAAARPMFYPVRRPKTHLVVIAHIQGQHYLCDCGFGSYGIRQPINLSQLNTPITQDADQYQLIKNEQNELVVQAWVDNQWVNQYGFTPQPQEWIDFVPANFLNSKHPDSIFVQKLLVVLFTPLGRKILFGNQFKTIQNGQTNISTVEPQHLNDVLLHNFGINSSQMLA